MAFANLIYIGLITERVPILPPFYPTHIGWLESPIAFGDVFDLQRLRTALNTPIVEWWDVKKRDSEHWDTLGCWNTWAAVLGPSEHGPFDAGARFFEESKIDMSYTRAPDEVKLTPPDDPDTHTSFWGLARLGFPQTSNPYLQSVSPAPSSKMHVQVPPDDDLLCFDFLYYSGAAHNFEFEWDYSPAWRFVARHMHWTPSLQTLADDYVRATFGIAADQKIPPFISMHIRHGDFGDICEQETHSERLAHCFASVSDLAIHVEDIRAEIREKYKIQVRFIFHGKRVA